MATHPFSYYLDYVLNEEGGYADLPGDEATNLGVKKSIWESWINRPATKEEVRRLTREDVAPLYKELYWDPCRCGEMPEGFNLATFDFSVHSGANRAILYLQEALKVVQDGVLGEKSMAALRKAGLKELLTYLDLRLEFIKHAGLYKLYGKGWLNRIHNLRAHVAAIFVKEKIKQ